MTREDIFHLVPSFYREIRKDDFIGPIFDITISKKEWPQHILRLTDFWETNLFGIPKFKGNPMEKHRRVDEKNDCLIMQKHFGRWLELWFKTIDANFYGDNALKAKNAARKMATGLFMGMFQTRIT